MGAITLLLQDDVPGLQVVRNHEWFTAKPIRDAFVVNLGDMSQVSASIALHCILFSVEVVRRGSG